MKLHTLALVCAGAAGASMFSHNVLAKTEVNFWYSGGTKPQQMMTKMIEEFNASQDEYVIKPALQGNYTETYQKLQAGLASHTAPELVLLNSSRAEAMYLRGLSRDITPYMDEEFNFSDFVGAFKNQVTAENGTIIGLPAYGTTQVFYYNKQVLAENGFNEQDLSTWQGVAKVAEKVTQRDDHGNTTFYGWEPMWGYNNMMDAAFSNGAKVISDDGKKVLIDSKEWVEVWDSFRKWIHDDQIMRVHHGGQGWEYWYKTIDDVMKGNALGYTGSSGDQGDLDFTKLAATTQPGWGNHPASPQAGALVYVMPKGTDDTAAKGAFEFVKFYTNAKNTAAWSMFTGYIPVRMSVKNVPEYQAYTANNPQALIPLKQATTATPDFLDPTNGKIIDALKVAADQIEIQNVPAEKALKQAAKKAQRALDRANRS
ncbi:extracellular solute-binding protein [Vibrio gazogenes]|uniref:Carbohydrate ABC transporter substrate-binding protein, CUT1 family (TC 3.A.1.1.-) n=1 Tax=Vibrio gazogenes DSM 21264 = NBRC 103151 TaxID=1123492 RepID=A0A1M5G1A1_VIBGA|nr:extracellular solute-binding protein [Vibrio gazogenes]USP14733.1 extracellular solute-binding protein [Vibrio gazogenes]SHF97535.1 carbohydrate ABC transporter substrate-binding protein, CUT1 family (TC 3.A.1.1.-) [Vibrio gazogenes DSM 21264] [Vibrio gazogenes DSM 21264 = NBRC 103151]SJN59116.1 sn-glycerol-3-phosphate-binding periplasmic protein UgpB precursor [Vibrio gazogenes]